MLIREMTIAVSSPVCTALPRSDTPRSLGIAQRSTSSTQTVLSAPVPVLRFPAVHRTNWYRLTTLAHARGQHGPALQEFLQHATYEAGARGILRNVPRLMLTYAAARGISERSAWRALKAACQRGWIRCTQHAAPGYPARYQLQVPVDLVVPGLPEDLETALRLWDSDALPEPDDADHYHGHLSQAPIEPVSMEPPAEPFPAPRTTPDTTSESVSDECQTSPYSAKALSPLWGESSTTPGANNSAEAGDAWRPGARRQPLSAEELTAARQVLARCQPWWQHQRGRFGVLSARELAGLVEPTALALRRSTANELVELVTVQCRSARSLAHLVGHRLWKLIKTRTEWDQVQPILPDGYRADDQGVEYARLVARRAAGQAPMAAGLAQARAAMRQGRQQAATAAREAEQARPPRRSWQREGEDPFLARQAVEEFEVTGSPLEIYRARAEHSQRERWNRQWNW